MFTYRDIVRDALNELGVLSGTGGDLSESDTTLGVTRFVAWLHEKSMSAFIAPRELRISHTFPAEQKLRHTIGPDEDNDIVSELPRLVETILYSLEGRGSSHPLTEMGREQLEANKYDYGYYPGAYYLERNQGGNSGVIHFDRHPQNRDKLKIIGRGSFVEPSDTEVMPDDQVQAPVEYRRAFILNLAEELANVYGVVRSHKDTVEARRALSKISARNDTGAGLRMPSGIMQIGTASHLGGSARGGNMRGAFYSRGR